MGFNEKVADALIADTDEFIVYWDYKKGWSCSEAGCVGNPSGKKECWGCWISCRIVTENFAPSF